MKKILIIGAIAFAFVAVLALGFTSWAFAQSDTPVCPYCGTGGGMMGRGGGFRGQGAAGEYGPMHDYMFPALAEAFGLTTDELAAAHAAGKTLWDIAQEQGKTFEQFQALMLEARTSAFEAMVSDGVLSQEQADWMLERMGGADGYGPGSGGCGMSGGAGYGMRGGGRWNSQP